MKCKVAEPTCRAILNSWDRIFLQPIESHLAWDYFYLGAEPSTKFLKEKEIAKIDPGMGCVMMVDIKAVEQATGKNDFSPHISSGTTKRMDLG